MANDDPGSWTAVLAEADLETAREIIRSQVEDLDLITAADAPTDALEDDGKLALQSFREALDQVQIMLEARAEDFEEGDDDDGDSVISASSSSSHSIDGGSDAADVDAPIPTTEDPSQQIADTRLESTDEPSSPKLLKGGTCDICANDGHCFTAPCSGLHSYCVQCLSRLFSEAMYHKARYPPSCCGTRIPFQSVRELLGQKLAEKFKEKIPELEESTPVYCHGKTCSSCIPRILRFGPLASCVKCSKDTCTLCRQDFHGQSECPGDEEKQNLLDTAAEHGWAQCKSCKTVVELSQGCYHITCHCGHQFCYLCGAEWKSCDCHALGEQYLVNEANRIAQQQGGFGDIQDIAVMIVLDEIWPHDRWIRVRGENDCLGCQDRMTAYIWQCEGCRFRLRYRCLFNARHAIHRAGAARCEGARTRPMRWWSRGAGRRGGAVENGMSLTRTATSWKRGRRFWEDGDAASVHLIFQTQLQDLVELVIDGPDAEAARELAIEELRSAYAIRAAARGEPEFQRELAASFAPDASSRWIDSPSEPEASPVSDERTRSGSSSSLDAHESLHTAVAAAGKAAEDVQAQAAIGSAQPTAPYSSLGKRRRSDDDLDLSSKPAPP